MLLVELNVLCCMMLDVAFIYSILYKILEMMIIAITDTANGV